MSTIFGPCIVCGRETWLRGCADNRLCDTHFRKKMESENRNRRRRPSERYCKECGFAEAHGLTFPECVKGGCMMIAPIFSDRARRARPDEENRTRTLKLEDAYAREHAVNLKY